jgi:hypothetical protein
VPHCRIRRPLERFLPLLDRLAVECPTATRAAREPGLQRQACDPPSG